MGFWFIFLCDKVFHGEENSDMWFITAKKEEYCSMLCILFLETVLERKCRKHKLKRRYLIMSSFTGSTHMNLFSITSFLSFLKSIYQQKTRHVHMHTCFRIFSFFTNFFLMAPLLTNGLSIIQAQNPR